MMHPAQASLPPQKESIRASITQNGLTTIAQVSRADLDKLFINALLEASTCDKHCLHVGSQKHRGALLRTHRRSRWRGQLRTSGQVRSYSAAAAPEQASVYTTQELSPAELLSMVDFYDGGMESEAATPSPEIRGSKDGPHPQTSQQESQQTVEESHVQRAQPMADDAGQAAIRRFRKILEDEDSTHEGIYAAYREIPAPRAAFLPDHVLRQFIRRLSIVPYKSEASALRYLSVIDDMKSAGHPIALGEWNSAVAFAGNCFRHITEVGLYSALRVWREMENGAGVQASNVTFNILFDLAAKAGKFPLADKIMKEMEIRGLTFNRYFRTSYIYFNGLKADGDGVRKAYKELVEAGEIVDTTTLNCVIASLINAGEPTAAELVFERMKRMHESKAGRRTPPRHWRQVRDLGRLLEKAARQFRNDEENRQKIQAQSPVAPDLQTFRILFRYHALKSGNIDRIMDLIDEMPDFNVQLDGSMFFPLWRGFLLNGGVRYTSWTQLQLEMMWSAFLRFWEEKPESFFMTAPMATSCLRAFAKCASEQRALAVWQEIRDRWKPPENDIEDVNRTFRVSMLRRSH